MPSPMTRHVWSIDLLADNGRILENMGPAVSNLFWLIFILQPDIKIARRLIFDKNIQSHSSSIASPPLSLPPM